MKWYLNGTLKKSVKIFKLMAFILKRQSKCFSTLSAWNVTMMIRVMVRIAGKLWAFSMMCYLWSIQNAGMLPALYRPVLRSLLNGGYIMAIVRHTAGKELNPEKQAAMRAEIKAAAERPYIYDPDSPLLTEKQLNEFCPVNYSTIKERDSAMYAAQGI